MGPQIQEQVDVMVDVDTNEGAGASGDEAAYPMFYKDPQMLDPNKHGTLGLVAGEDYSFAAHSNVIPVSGTEMPLAARSYPLVFIGTQGRAMPIAIVGLRARQNLFVNDQGDWLKPHYVLGYVRRYPFVFMRNQAADNFVLCFDQSSKLIQKGGERALFEKGAMTDTAKERLAFCTQFQKGIVASERAMAVMLELDLLIDRRGDFKLQSGETLSLTDFQVVDEAKLNRLSDADFIKLRKVGALPMIHCHLISMNSWSHLVHLEAGSGR